MTNSASDILNSVQKGFAGKVTTPTNKTKTHEVDDPSITFRLKGAWPHCFFYSQVKSTRITDKGLIVKTYDAFITIKGRNLDPLRKQILRKKLFEISISSKHENESEEPFIESISIYYTDEDETYE